VIARSAISFTTDSKATARTNPSWRSRDVGWRAPATTATTTRPAEISAPSSSEFASPPSCSTEATSARSCNA
jgi:hypothetical protein